MPGDYLPAGTELLHITDDAAEAGRAPVRDSLLPDPVLAIEALLGQLKSDKRRHTLNPKNENILPSATNGPLTPAEVYATSQSNRPEDVVIVEESSSTADFHKWLPINKPASYFSFAHGGLAGKWLWKNSLLVVGILITVIVVVCLVRRKCMRHSW